MRPNRYTSTLLFASILALIASAPVQAQYGSGIVLDVPYASSPIEIDGIDDDADWDLATFIDLVQQWEAGWIPGYGDPDNPEAIANARLLWREGVLYMFVYVEQENHDLYLGADNPWQNSHLLVGVDLTGEDDEAYDHNWAGWPENAPDQGAVAYKINPASGVTLNWGLDGAPDPVVEGWVEAAMVVHEGDRAWSLEMAIHGVDHIESGAEIGFNIAGAISSNPPGHEWGWFLYSFCDPVPPPPPGGETRCHWAGGVQSDARGYALLNLVGGPGEGYGTGVVQQVPQATGPITLDGDPSEAAWDDAVEIDLTENWNGGFYGWGSDIPDIFSTARLLWDDGVLYILLHSQHPYPLFFNPDGDQGAQGPWDANHFLVGVDLTHEGDDQIDNSWSGWPWNAPDLGPTAYKINPLHGGITSNWHFGWDENPEGIDPVALGYVDGAFFIDYDAQEWGLEMAIYGEEIQEGALIGFNAGGAAAAQEACDNTPECAYAWYSWQAISQTSAGGDVMRVAASYGSLHFVQKISGEEGPTAGAEFSISSSFPNPFRSSTTLVYQMERDGFVELALYDLLGRRIAILDDGPRVAGEHHIPVDGSALASGVYMVRLSVDGKPAASHSMLRIN